MHPILDTHYISYDSKFATVFHFGKQLTISRFIHILFYNLFRVIIGRSEMRKSLSTIISNFLDAFKTDFYIH